MNLLLISMLMLGTINSQLTIFANHVSNISFEVVFDINKLEDGNLIGHPDITCIPPEPRYGSWFRASDKVSVRYHSPPLHNIHQLRIHGYYGRSAYHALRGCGFTPEQLSRARPKHISIHGDHDIYEIKTSTRDYTVTLSKFEQSLSHDVHGCTWHAYEGVIIRWK